MAKPLAAHRAILAVFGGGLSGTLARFLLSSAFQAAGIQGWPVDLVLINVLGSFLLACCTTLADATLLIGPTRRLAINVGFIGAFTTWSSFALGDVLFTIQGEWLQAGSYLVVSMAGGSAATVLGTLVGERWVKGIWQPAAPHVTRLLPETLAIRSPDEKQMLSHAALRNDSFQPVQKTHQWMRRSFFRGYERRKSSQ